MNYEGFRQSLGGIPSVGTVPSQAFRARILAAQPSHAAFINAYPVSTTVSASDPNAALFISVVPSPDQENSGVIRVDHRLGNHDSMYARFNIDDGVSTTALSSIAQSVTSRVQNFVLEKLHTFNATLLNESEFGFDRNTYIQKPGHRHPV